MEKKHSTYKIYSKKTIIRIENKIKLLGTHYKYDEIDFLNFRLCMSIIIFLGILFLSKYGFVLAPIITILFLIISERLFLDYPIKKRAEKLEDDAIFFFEVLDLTLKSGRNLKYALEITAENIDSELSQEFKKTLAEVKLGKSFTESLNDMKERIPSESVNNVLLNLTQSNLYGSNISKTLVNQLDYLREKKLLRIKAEIVKLPTKISVISVVFFIPIMFLIILAPVIVEFLTR